MGYLSWILGAMVALLFGFLAPLEDYREELRSKLLGLRGFRHTLFGNRQISLFAGFFLAIFYIARFLLELPLWALYWIWRSYYCLIIAAIVLVLAGLIFGLTVIAEPSAPGEGTVGPWSYPAAWFYLAFIGLLFFVPAFWQLQVAKDWWNKQKKE